MESYIQTALQSGQPSAGLVLLVLAAGVLTSLAPCVYPMVPITASIVGRFSTGRIQSALYSLIYVLGLAAVYALLGVLAALTGHLFGSVASHPLVLAGAALLCILLALWMSGLVRLPALFGSLRAPQNSPFRPPLLFAMGAASGLVMAPCTSPVLGILLIFVASQGQPLWGALLMFIFSLGMSSLLVLVGTFSGALTQLPKAGPWMK